MKTCGDFGGRKKNGEPCGNPAGARTPHKGTGKCYRHGGCSIGPPLKHGRYAKSLNGRLGTKIKEYLKDPDPMDLRPELAVLRARISYLTEEIDKQTDDIQETSDKSIEDVSIKSSTNRASAEELLSVVYGVQKVVDTISKIQAREALTAQESLYILVSLADILQTEMHYIRKEAISDEDALRHIISKLRSRVSLPRLAGREDIL